MRPHNWGIPLHQDEARDGCQYANSIFLLKGTKMSQFELPSAKLDSLEIFDVLPGHPSYPGRGVRAKCLLEADTELGFYAGYLRAASYVADNPYVFDVGNELAIDARLVGNITRYINDPRGTTKGPNVETLTTEMKFKSTNVPVVMFKASARIGPGDELLLRYEASSKGYWG